MTLYQRRTINSSQVVPGLAQVQSDEKAGRKLIEAAFAFFKYTDFLKYDNSVSVWKFCEGCVEQNKYSHIVHT